MATLRFQVQGELGSITLAGFLGQIKDHLRMLKDYDVALSRQQQGSLDWLITNVTTGSLIVETESRSRLEQKNFGPDVTRVYVDGWARIEHEGTSPPYLTEQGMKAARRIVRRIGREGMEGLVVSDRAKTVAISPKASAHIDQLIPVKYRSLGSAEGTLETISIHRGTRFVLYHSRTKKAIRCDIPSSTPDLLNVAKEALGRRVRAVGLLEANARGELLRVKADHLRVLRTEDELPTIASLGGKYPDLTEGLATEDYIRSLRSA